MTITSLFTCPSITSFHSFFSTIPIIQFSYDFLDFSSSPFLSWRFLELTFKKNGRWGWEWKKTKRSKPQAREWGVLYLFTCIVVTSGKTQASPSPGDKVKWPPTLSQSFMLEFCFKTAKNEYWNVTCLVCLLSIQRRREPVNKLAFGLDYFFVRIIFRLDYYLIFIHVFFVFCYHTQSHN